jgi:hypothetical protein
MSGAKRRANAKAFMLTLGAGLDELVDARIDNVL